MNDHLQPVSEDQLEARITAWVLGEASPFEIAELESLVAKSPELQLFFARTLAIHSLLKEAETTANAPSEDWKLPDEKRAKLSPILGDIQVHIPEKETRIRRASFRAAWGMAAVLILTFFTERFLFIPATSDKNMSQTVRNTADIAHDSGAPLGNATPEEMFAAETGSPAPIATSMLTLDESALAPRVSMAFVARSGGINDNDKQQTETIGNILPSARREVRARSSVELERGIVESRERPAETSIRVGVGAILNNADPAAKARNRGNSESKKATGKVDMIAGSILETEGLSGAASLGLPPTPSESELAPLVASSNRKGLEDSVSLPQDLARSLRDKAQKKADLSDSSTEIAAAQEPFSTFSLNISDASFQLAVAAVEKGERPDPESIKPEQFYNAVDYGDPAPSSLEPVAAAIDQTAHPVIPGRNLVRVAIRTASTGRSAAQPLRLTLLVDQSGSMARADRRAALDTALAQLATLLTENDRITVIGFSRTPCLFADSLPGNEAAKIPDLINPTASEGGTNLEQAFNLSSEPALRHKLDGAQNRIVLFTDGAANFGDADPERLAGRVKELRQQGLAFDIAGIGTNDTNDRLLSELARHGNGRYYLVGENAGDSFAAQLAGAFRPAAENVKVQVKFNPERVGNFKLIGFEKDRLKTEDFHDDSVDVELAADEAGVAIYQVETLPEGSGEIGEVSVRFRDSASGEMVERAWTIPHDPSTPAFDKADPKTQLATLALLAAQKLQGGPLADAIRFPDHAETIAKLKQTYAKDAKAQRLLTLINALR